MTSRAQIHHSVPVTTVTTVAIAVGSEIQMATGMRPVAVGATADWPRWPRQLPTSGPASQLQAT